VILLQAFVGGAYRYAAAFCIAVMAFVHGYEEPALSRSLGAQYEAYRRAVPAWRPRRRPWVAKP
jgi:protein-S-isoprenylcysteine O-methyltransferase Ste14